MGAEQDWGVTELPLIVAKTQSDGIRWLIGLLYLVHVSAVGLLAFIYCVETDFFGARTGEADSPVITTHVVIAFLATFCVEVLGVCAIAFGGFYNNKTRYRIAK